jgi:ComF family protein
LAGKIPAEIRVTAFCFYKKKSIIQKLIHRLKYKDDYRVGTYFGYLFGMDLQQEKTFNSIDIIVPVPLHPDKLKLRGYNQSEAIAKGIAMVMHKTIDISSLVRIKRTKTQTKKDIHERAVNMVDAFQLKETDNLKRKHILLVDDVITTGATIETATKTLLSIPDVKISIACLACGNS